MKTRHTTILFPFIAALLCALPARGQEQFRFPEAKHGQGALRYIDEVPVLIVQGTPEEIGAQVGTLALKPADALPKLGDGFIKAQGWEAVYPLLLKTGNFMVTRFPRDHIQELEAAANSSGWPRDLLILGNTLPDLRKLASCSTLVVESDRSATGNLLFGRNLDWPPFGTLHEFTFVTIYRVTGKCAFASVGYPGMLGCVSGINDAGLALADLTVTSANDGSRQFDPAGTPYTLALRRVLEECASVEEAEKLLRSLKRTTMQNVAICDRTKGAVFEITTKNLVVRPAVDGVCACTNHFRSEQLATTGTRLVPPIMR
jgi:hypothetical protein